MTDVEPMLESKRGPALGERDGQGNVRFETAYVCKEKLQGPDFKKEKDGRLFVYVGWYGTKGDSRVRFRRLKVHLDAAANLVWDTEIVVAGRAKDGSPACASATVIGASNIDDFLNRGLCHPTSFSLNPEPSPPAPRQAPPR